MIEMDLAQAPEALNKKKGKGAAARGRTGSIFASAKAEKKETEARDSKEGNEDGAGNGKEHREKKRIKRNDSVSSNMDGEKEMSIDSNQSQDLRRSSSTSISGLPPNPNLPANPTLTTNPAQASRGKRPSVSVKHHPLPAKPSTQFRIKFWFKSPSSQLSDSEPFGFVC